MWNSNRQDFTCGTSPPTPPSEVSVSLLLQQLSVLLELDRLVVLRMLMLVSHHKLCLHFCYWLFLLGKRGSQEILQVVRNTAS